VSEPENTLKDKTAIVGVGATPYYKRGQSLPQSPMELAGKAVIAALADAGLTVNDLDGFALYSMGFDTSLFAQWLGVPEVRFTGLLSGGGGGSAGSVGLASAAVVSGMAECVVSVMTLQQAASRFGASFAPRGVPGAVYSAPPSPEGSFLQPSGLMGPGQMFAVLAQRHMHLYGTTRDHFCDVAISTRNNAIRRSTSLMQEPLTREQYFGARMISDPLCLYDFCLECDGAVAVVTTSVERARDLRHPPVVVGASANGGHGRWGQAITWLGMPDEYFASSGHRPVATRLYDMAGVGPADVDVALLYDHFTPMVIMQLEDYGFCGIGEGGPFVADGNIRWPEGRLPVNTHGGNLSEAYIIGMTHVKEAVEQLRGTAVNQVDGAEVALVTGGPASIPVSSLLLHN
jgi:acetyl-CoA acetyltransferase